MALQSEVHGAVTPSRQNLGTNRALQINPRKTEAKRERAFKAAARHSAIVKVVRSTLPIVALAASGFYFFGTPLKIEVGNNEASIEAVEITSDRLKMVNPRLAGFNEKHGDYVITADAAYQNIKNPDTVELEQIRADMKHKQGGPLNLVADQGVFDSKKEFLVLTGNISLTTESGMEANLQTAEVDMKTSTIRSDNPVQIAMSGTTVESATVSMNTETQKIDFLNDVRVRLTPAQKSTSASTPSPARSGLRRLSPSRTLPIDIVSDRLSIADQSNRALFTGAVTAVQGTYRLTSDALDISYVADQRPEAGASTSGDIERLEARGKVKVESQNGRQATARKLIFQMENETLNMIGDVLLVQGQNTLRGNELLADLKAGRTTFRPGGRVYGKFAPRSRTGQATTRRSPGAQDGLGSAMSIDLTAARGKPITIEAATMTLEETKQTVSFDGKVKAVQGGYNINAAHLTVHYMNDVAGASDTANADIKMLKARGDVHIRTPNKQSARADWATYDVIGEKMILGGNISLLRGDDVLKGQRLVIDLKRAGAKWKQRQCQNR